MEPRANACKRACYDGKDSPVHRAAGCWQGRSLASHTPDGIEICKSVYARAHSDTLTAILT